MLVALPVESDKKENSILFGHFAVAPGFVTFDTETGDYGYIENSDGKADGGGSRNASERLASAGVTAVIAGGIGMGAINRLNSMGIRVYGSLSGMVLYELKLLESGKLPEMTEGNCDGAYR